MGGLLAPVYVQDKRWFGVVAGLACVAPLASLGYVAYIAAAGLLPNSSPGQLLSNILTWAGIGVVSGLVVGIVPALLTTMLLVLLQRWRGHLHLGWFVLACLPALLLGIYMLVGGNAFYAPARYFTEFFGMAGLLLGCVLCVWTVLRLLGVLRPPSP